MICALKSGMLKKRWREVFPSFVKSNPGFGFSTISPISCLNRCLISTERCLTLSSSWILIACHFFKKLSKQQIHFRVLTNQSQDDCYQSALTHCSSLLKWHHKWNISEEWVSVNVLHTFPFVIVSRWLWFTKIWG